MLVMKGKYNIAKIMIDTIDDTTRQQIQFMLNSPSFKHGNIVIMPDCHAGKGSVIGFTWVDGRRAIPNVVGVDISCGVSSVAVPKEVIESIGLENFDRIVKNVIPSGFSVNKIVPKKVLSLLKIPVDGEEMRVTLTNLCIKVAFENARCMNSIGTLGGGNHFIEIGICDGEYRIFVHSGSRGIGNKVAKYHQEQAVRNCERTCGLFGINIPEDIKGVEFLDKDQAKEYIQDSVLMNAYAMMSRMQILNAICEAMGIVLGFDVLNCSHNYTDSKGTVRKGAISAEKGELCLIPLTMKDGIILAEGKGNKQWNCSAPHGAGRILSRTQAKNQINVESFVKEMKDANVYTSTATIETLDEAPEAYKAPEEIIRCIEPTVEIKKIFKPIYNFKAVE